MRERERERERERDVCENGVNGYNTFSQIV